MVSKRIAKHSHTYSELIFGFNASAVAGAGSVAAMLLASCVDAGAHQHIFQLLEDARRDYLMLG